jgi:hypothetical protein
VNLKVALVVAVVVSMFGGFVASKAHDASVAVQVANAALKTAAARADAAEKRAAVVEAQVVALRAQRDSALSRANQKSRLATRLTGSLALLAKAAPDTCRPIVAAADSTVDILNEVIAQKNNVIADDFEIQVKLQVSNDSLRAALTGLSQAAHTEVKAVAKQEHRSLLARLLPTPGIGVAAGFTPAGAPTVLTGVTLSWQVR